jgi:NAD(P)-dependent dehydrogenase (short-subunit alcohol dehydrogenase family)
MAEPRSLEGRCYVVTGCSINSLGYATAKSLLEWGGEVTITARSRTDRIVDALKAALPTEAHSRIFAHELDLADEKSTRQFAQWYIEERKTLDVLINNAGIHLDLLSQWKQPKLSADGIEIQWRTNYLGTTQLSHLLLPLLKDSAARTGDARLVNVVSMLHSKGANSEFFTPSKPYNSWEAYGLSKLGLVHFSMECQRRFGDQGLQAFCLHPGSVYTNVAAKGLSGNPAIENIRNWLAPIERFFLKTPEEGAQTQLYCATSAEAQGGKYYRDCKVASPSAEAFDVNIAERLWESSLPN